MPSCHTKYFGPAGFEESSVLEFPAGLPGFEEQRRFLPLRQPGHEPLVFLQSIETPDLCFVAMPANAVDPGYQLEVSEPDLELLGLDPAQQPAIGAEVLCLAILTIAESGVTANLLAPVVIHLKNSRAVQAIAPGLRYSHCHPVQTAEAAC